jgi:hypothetical protein
MPLGCERQRQLSAFAVDGHDTIEVFNVRLVRLDVRLAHDASALDEDVNSPKPFEDGCERYVDTL